MAHGLANSFEMLYWRAGIFYPISHRKLIGNDFDVRLESICHSQQQLCWSGTESYASIEPFRVAYMMIPSPRVKECSSNKADSTPAQLSRMLEYGVKGCIDHVTGLEKWPGFTNEEPGAAQKREASVKAANYSSSEDTAAVPAAETSSAGTGGYASENASLSNS